MSSIIISISSSMVGHLQGLGNSSHPSSSSNSNSNSNSDSDSESIGSIAKKGVNVYGNQIKNKKRRVDARKRRKRLMKKQK